MKGFCSRSDNGEKLASFKRIYTHFKTSAKVISIYDQNSRYPIHDQNGLKPYPFGPLIPRESSFDITRGDEDIETQSLKF